MLKKFVLIVVASLLVFSGVARAQTNYPAQATVEVRDENGNLIGEAGVFVGDPLTVFATGWFGLVFIQATWFSDPVDLGKHQTNEKGELRFTFNVPDVPPIPGVHTLRLEGTGADGNFRRVDVAIKVKPRPAGGTTTTSTTLVGNNGGGGGGSNVLGKTQENGGVNNSSAFAKTGAFLARTAYVGFALLAMGAALFLAVRKRNVATR